MAAAGVSAATDHVLGDLLDTLLAEGLLTGGVSPDGMLRSRLGDGRLLRVAARRDAAGAVRTCPPAWLGGAPATPLAVLDAVADSRWPAADEVRAALACALDHAAWAEQHRAEVERALLARPAPQRWERLAALRDRPFCPLAKARVGWERADLDRYAPEAAPSLRLRWAAVERGRVRHGPGSHRDPAELLLDDREQAALEGRLRPGEMALPVHPAAAGELAAGARLLPVAAGEATPTASVRTLTLAARASNAVKLPLPVATLGAQRTLPPRSLANGVVGQRLLEEVAARLPGPVALHVCDETAWWVADGGGGLTGDDGRLGCLVRRRPVLPPDRQLLPLGALAYTGPHLPAVRALLGGRPSVEQALAVLADVASAVTAVGLTAFGLGVVPELHGQNVLLHMQHGRVREVVLRDHDSVRVHLPWLRAARLPEPVFSASPSSPNTLVNGSPEELLAWFQTLAVAVGLGGVADAVAAGRAAVEVQAWSVIAGAVRDSLDRLDLPPAATEVARRCLLDAPAWPHKQVLRPWLCRTQEGSTSMPSAMGTAGNPLARALS